MVGVRCLGGSSSLFERPLSLARSIPSNGVSSTCRDPKPTQSVVGALYIVLIEDDFSRFGWTHFMKQKSGAGATFQRLLNDIRGGTISSVVECVRSDGGGELSGGAFRELCDDRGIRQDITMPDTPQLNGGCVGDRSGHCPESRAGRLS